MTKETILITAPAEVIPAVPNKDVPIALICLRGSRVLGVVEPPFRHSVFQMAAAVNAISPSTDVIAYLRSDLFPDSNVPEKFPSGLARALDAQRAKLQDVVIVDINGQWISLLERGLVNWTSRNDPARWVVNHHTDVRRRADVTIVISAKNDKITLSTPFFTPLDEIPAIVLAASSPSGSTAIIHFSDALPGSPEFAALEEKATEIGVAARKTVSSLTDFIVIHIQDGTQTSMAQSELGPWRKGHTELCINAQESWREAAEAYDGRWPNHCKECQGWGGMTGQENGAPSGEGFWAMPVFSPCLTCTEDFMCARCYTVMDEDDYLESRPCASCGWDWGDGEDDVRPQPPICQCEATGRDERAGAYRVGVA